MLRSRDGGKQRNSARGGMGGNCHRAKVNSQRDRGWEGVGSHPGPQRTQREAASTHSPIYLRCTTSSSEFPFGELEDLVGQGCMPSSGPGGKIKDINQVMLLLPKIDPPQMLSQSHRNMAALTGVWKPKSPKPGVTFPLTPGDTANSQPFLSGPSRYCCAKCCSCRGDSTLLWPVWGCLLWLAIIYLLASLLQSLIIVAIIHPC